MLALLSQHHVAVTKKSGDKGFYCVNNATESYRHVSGKEPFLYVSMWYAGSINGNVSQNNKPNECYLEFQKT